MHAFKYGRQLVFNFRMCLPWRANVNNHHIFKIYFCTSFEVCFVNVWIIALCFFYLKSWMYQFMVFWTPLRIYNMCPVINSSVMKDMLLIYLIIFQYNHACTCTAIILVYVLYQYYLTLPYLILYTRLIADFVCYMNVFIFRKLFLPLFTPFLKWIRMFWIEKKLHKWYLYFSFTYFFSRIYILIWCHV